MFRKSFTPLFLLTIYFFQSCATKTETKIITQAANRKMALSFRVKNPGPFSPEEAQAYFEPLFLKTIEKAYGAKGIPINLEKTNILETPVNIYEIGKNEVDDLFVAEIDIPRTFEFPKDSSSAPTDPGIIKSTIYNGSNLKAVTIVNHPFLPKPKTEFEDSFVTDFSKAMIQAFPNPNIYPRTDSKHFANLLFVFSEKHEKEFTEILTCENAAQRLIYFKWSKALYEIASKKGNMSVAGQAEEAHLMATRLSESSAKAKIVDDCAEDAKKTFELLIDYGNIPAENQVFLQKAFEATDFASLLKQYTNKPVKFRFQVESAGSLSMFVDLRFDQKKYQAWTIKRIPQKIRNLQILSLDPYHALMQKMVIFRTALPGDAPFSLRTAIAGMRMMLILATLLNGEVSFAVDGKYIRDANIVKMAYPTKVIFNSTAFESRSIANRDDDIFQAHGYISLGNCKTLDGTKTEDGLIYDFFGFPCE